LIAIDMPGCGNSDPLPGDAPSIEAYTECVANICDALSIAEVVVYGRGVGASVAIAMKMKYPDVVGRIALHGVMLPDELMRKDLRSRLAPPIILKDDGAHWYDTWLMLRDSLTSWPWYNGTYGGFRGTEEECSPEKLHEWTVEVMKQWSSYQHVINAAINYDATAAISCLGDSLLICEDETHRLSVYDPILRSLAPNAKRLLVSKEIGEFAGDLVPHLLA